jgi:outer membrane receptor for ferrienterochelin and colicin
MKQFKMVIYLFTLVFAFAFIAQAQSGVSYRISTENQTFDIEAQALESALKAYEMITDINLDYSEEIVKGKKTNGVRGTHTLSKALQKILMGTGLSYMVTAQGLVALKETEAVELEKMLVTVPETEGLSEASAFTTVITKEQIEAANLDNISDALRLAPNVWQKRNYSPKIHGQPALVLIDGQMVTTGGCPGRGRVAELDEFSVDQIERIEIITGGQAVLYGEDAMGGVINIITKSPTKKPTFSASSSIASHDTEAYKVSHGYKPGKFGYLFNYSHMETDGIVEEKDKKRTDELWANLTYEFSPTNKLTFTPKFHKKTKLPEGSDKTVYRRHMLNGKWDYKIDDVSALNVMGAYQNRWYFSTRSNNRIRKEFTEAKVTYNRLLFGSNLITTSYQFWNERAYDDINCHGLVIHDEISLDPFIVTLGLRVDNHSRYDEYYSPSAGLLYKITDDLKLRGSVGKGIRYNSYAAGYYDEWSYSRGKWYHRPPGLDPECLTSYELGGEYRILDNLLATISLFRDDVEDKVQTVDTGTIITRDGTTAPLWERKNIGEARTEGVDVVISSDITKNIFASVGYTFLDTENKDTGKELTYNPEHKLNFILNWNIPDYGLKAHWRTEYVGEKWQDSNNTKKLSDYWVSNVSLAKGITKHGKLTFSVDNLFNKHYEDISTSRGVTTDSGLYELPDRAYKVELKVFF